MIWTPGGSSFSSGHIGESMAKISRRLVARYFYYIHCKIPVWYQYSHQSISTIWYAVNCCVIVYFRSCQSFSPLINNILDVYECKWYSSTKTASLTAAELEPVEHQKLQKMQGAGAKLGGEVQQFCICVTSHNVVLMHEIQ